MLRILEIIVALVLAVLLFREKPGQIIHVLRLLAIIVVILAIIPSMRFSFSFEGFESAPGQQSYSEGFGQLNKDIQKQAGTYAYDPHFIRGDAIIRTQK